MDTTGVSSTSAVGCFPAGNAVCGATDMSGNVWEWCSTKWLSNYHQYAEQVNDDLAGDARRVVRGGSFVLDQNGAIRRYFDLGARVIDLGFRVVWSPGL